MLILHGQDPEILIVIIKDLSVFRSCGSKLGFQSTNGVFVNTAGKGLSGPIESLVFSCGLRNSSLWNASRETLRRILRCMLGKQADLRGTSLHLFLLFFALLILNLRPTSDRRIELIDRTR